MKFRSTIATVGLLILAAPFAVAEPVKWTSDSGAVSLTVPDGWDVRSTPEYPLTTNRKIKTPKTDGAGCGVTIAKQPASYAAFSQNQANEGMARITAKTVVSEPFEVYEFSNSKILSGIRLIDYALKMPSGDIQVGRKFNLVRPGAFETIHIFCRASGPPSTAVKGDIDAFVASLSIKK